MGEGEAIAMNQPETLMEWRQWPDGWSFTGTAGINIPDRIRRPNTQLFPPNFDPNTMTEPTRSPPCKILIDPATAGKTPKHPSLEWHRARIAHAHQIVSKLIHNPAYTSLIREFKAAIDESLEHITNADENTCEDF